MIYTHVLNRGAGGVKSPLDGMAAAGSLDAREPVVAYASSAQVEVGLPSPAAYVAAAFSRGLRHRGGGRRVAR